MFGVFHLSGMFFKIIPGPSSFPAPGAGGGSSRGVAADKQEAPLQLSEGLGTHHLTFQSLSFPILNMAELRGSLFPITYIKTDVNWVFGQGFG